MSQVDAQEVSQWEMSKRIQDRIQGRQLAEDALALFELEGKSLALRESFVNVLTTQLLPEAVAKHEHEPIARLGGFEMPYGQYKGQQLNEVPLDYLDWLCSAEEDLLKTLRAYLKHPELESRRPGE